MRSIEAKTDQPTPSSRRYARNRDAILAAARSILTERGVEALSIRTLAEQVDYTPSAIYKYFSGKEEILDELRMEGFRRMGQGMPDRSDPDPNAIPALLIEAGESYLRFALQNPQYYNLMFNTPNQAVQTVDSIATHPNFAGILELVRAGLARGVFHLPPDYTDVTLAFHLWFTLHGMAMLGLSLMSQADDSFARMCDQILRSSVDALQRAG